MNKQQKINELQAQIDALKAETVEYCNWSTAPVICELNGSRWILGPAAPEELNWNDAVAWCNSVGGELPPRDILLHCYLNEEIRDLFTTTNYWSSTELSATDAWVQGFKFGFQNSGYKTYTLYVRAVRRLDI